MADDTASGSSKRLSTRETADRLGVKPETVYAYVSRGLLTSRRAPGGRGSTFDLREVDALARRSGRARNGAESTASGTDTGFPGGGPWGETLSARTGITLIDADRYYFRGVDACALAARFGYEETASWLWTGVLTPGIRFTAPHESLAAARRSVEALPRHSGLVDRLRAAVIAAAVTDPLRFDLTAPTVLAAAPALIATLVRALPLRDPGAHAGADAGAADDASTTLAGLLWPRLSRHPADQGSLRVLDAALTLLIDHDLAASTLAARVAASARAHPYAVVSAGLGAVDGPLHGAASGLAHRLLTDVLERGSAAAVVADHLREGRRVPGLGHRLYPGEDPRAGMLFGLLEDLPQAAPALAAAREVVETTARYTPLHANVDLALAVLSVSAGMPAEAGETVFAVARTAGWIAHALEEYQEHPLRLRPSGHYTGPRPPQPLP
ncbi:citrate synthase [Streptomyces sp. H10-C2]|uniref:citrate synthase n=1 Tax=unclassified Streptomyces TaxID=2593676 RepID=UPI0024BA87D4|nr:MULTISPECIES: citrate synthase [unclassified Streptomyces]MDJ0343900.1 citrate synthase [Streptomyces sp. PH10-H1]MDJ0373341.1 citrate synthase [Streptomyces sp. H10-C2]